MIHDKKIDACQFIDVCLIVIVLLNRYYNGSEREQFNGGLIPSDPCVQQLDGLSQWPSKDQKHQQRSLFLHPGRQEQLIKHLTHTIHLNRFG